MNLNLFDLLYNNMSRYRVESLNPKYKVEVGFDHACNSEYCTYFAQVTDLDIEAKLDNLSELSAEEEKELEDKLLVLWIGNDYLNPIRSIDELKLQLTEYAIIPDDIALLLRTEAGDEREAFALTPVFQEWMELMEGVRGNIREEWM